ncbi:MULTISPECIES: hypothetical protein [Streptomyces]|uniref:hypothetical protein n=1 Tax=Streptomyces TaxID=1883 RepID=UPI003628B869
MSDHDNQLSFDDVNNEPDLEDSDDYWLIPLDDFFQAWKSSIERLRTTGSRIAALTDDLEKALTSHDARLLDRTVTALREIAECARESDFTSLCLETAELHNRGTGVLDPDRTQTPKKSPFVRVIPQWEVSLATKDRELQSRHIVAYEVHLRQTFTHFQDTWAALVDGALICDFVMVEGEFPKLDDLAREAQKARKMWTEAMRPWLAPQR